MNKLTAQQYEQITACLAQCSAVVAGYRFGSQCSEKQSSPRDVDLAVFGRRRLSLDELLDIRREIALLLGTDQIDLVDLQTAGPVLKRNVIACGGRFFCRDAHEANEFELQALAEYQDSTYRRGVQADMLRRALSTQ